MTHTFRHPDRQNLLSDTLTCTCMPYPPTHIHVDIHKNKQYAVRKTIYMMSTSSTYVYTLPLVLLDTEE